MRLLVDAQLPPGLADWFGLHDFSATSVREVGLGKFDDGGIWSFVCQGQWTLVTKDEDFVGRCLAETDSPSVIWIRLGNCTNRVLFAWLEALLPEIKLRLAAGDKVIELR